MMARWLTGFTAPLRERWRYLEGVQFSDRPQPRKQPKTRGYRDGSSRNRGDGNAAKARKRLQRNGGGAEVEGVSNILGPSMRSKPRRWIVLIIPVDMGD